MEKRCDFYKSTIKDGKTCKYLARGYRHRVNGFTIMSAYRLTELVEDPNIYVTEKTTGYYLSFKDVFNRSLELEKKISTLPKVETYPDY